MLLADAVERHATKRLAHLTGCPKALRCTHPAMGLGLRARSLGRRIEHGAQASMENPDDLSAAGALEMTIPDCFVPSCLVDVFERMKFSAG